MKLYRRIKDIKGKNLISFIFLIIIENLWKKFISYDIVKLVIF